MLELLIFMIVAYIPICVLCIVSPLMSKRSICFGVAIPEEHMGGELIESIKKSYKSWGVVISIISLLPIVAFQPWRVESRVELAISTVLFSIIVLQIVLYFAFYKKVKRIKGEQGWQIQLANTGRVMIDTSFHKAKKVYSNHWFFLHLLVVLLTAVYLIYIYDEIPNVMATHYDLQGNADGFSNKSVMTVFDLSFMQLFMIGLFIGCNWLTAISKQQVDPKNPERSLANNIKFRRLCSLFMIVLGFIIVVFFSMLKVGSVREVSSSFTGASSTLFLAVLVIVSTYFIIAMVRLKRMPFVEETTVLPMDADQYWKLGMLYYNPADPALFVEKRFGIGYTVNIGRPMSWLVILAPFVIIGIIIFLTSGGN
ncbi:MAG: DUF1648 domain-containing protein [Candidatus Pristimantibacillus sp.]